MRPTRLAVIALLLLPIIEIVVIVAVGEAIGGWPTFLLIVATSLLGAWLIRREGGQGLARPRPGGAQRADAGTRDRRRHRRARRGGLLLVPGFVTDVVGLVLVLPFARPVARNLLAAVISRRLVAQTDGYTCPR